MPDRCLFRTFDLYGADLKPALSRMYWSVPVFGEYAADYRTYGQTHFEHRVGGPSSIRWYCPGRVADVRWCQEGVLHREDGPAMLRYDSTSTLTFACWATEGVAYQREGVIPGYHPCDV